MGNDHSQPGCCYRLLRCCCCRNEDEENHSILVNGKNRKHEINQSSEVMEYRFTTPSDPTSEVPSEYHSETEEDGAAGVEGEGKKGERRKKTVAGHEDAIPVNSPSHSGPKWRLVPSHHVKHSQKQ